MSGRKYSLVELANNVRGAIRCRLEAEEACAHAESLVAALTEAARSTPALMEAASSAGRTFAEIKNHLDDLSKTFDESRMMQLTLDQVQQERQRVERLKLNLDRISNECRAGNEAAALRVELVAVIDRLQKDRDEIEPWLRDVYDPFTEETRRLLEQSDEEIRARGSISALAGRIHQQIARYEAMREKAAERRLLDRERRHIAYALKSVCAEMAFDANLLPQSGPLEDLVVEVNTFAYGMLEFRLQLDGTIRSRSEMIEASCCANFSMIEDKLRALGVLSGFRYEADQQPVRLRKGEKSLSDSEPGATRREGL
ncbi:MAG: hypothetical protein AB1631_12790 [Acidobacteriota bacterium]